MRAGVRYDAMRETRLRERERRRSAHGEVVRAAYVNSLNPDSFLDADILLSQVSIVRCSGCAASGCDRYI